LRATDEEIPSEGSPKGLLLQFLALLSLGDQVGISNEKQVKTYRELGFEPAPVEEILMCNMEIRMIDKNNSGGWTNISTGQ
jgi:hypothetical protein